MSTAVTKAGSFLSETAVPLWSKLRKIRKGLNEQESCLARELAVLEVPPFWKSEQPATPRD